MGGGSTVHMDGANGLCVWLLVGSEWISTGYNHQHGLISEDDRGGACWWGRNNRHTDLTINVAAILVKWCTLSSTSPSCLTPLIKGLFVRVEYTW